MTEPVPINLQPAKSVPKIVPVASRDNFINNAVLSKSNELKIYLPSLQDLYTEMCHQVQTNVLNILEEVLQNIAKDKGLNLVELNTDYLAPLKNLMNVNQNQLSNTSSKKQRKIDPSEQCMARTQGGNQCSRKKQTNYNFCGSHLTSQPNGRIDQPPPQSNKVPKRRGRPPKKKVISVQDYPTISPQDLMAQNTYEEMVAAMNGPIQTTFEQEQKGPPPPKQTSQIKPKPIKPMKKTGQIALEHNELQSIIQEADNKSPTPSSTIEEEVTQVNFRMLEVNGNPIIIDDDTNKIYEMPDLEKTGGTIDITDLHHIGNLEPNGNLVFL